jgi:hypothetical protein
VADVRDAVAVCDGLALLIGTPEGPVVEGGRPADGTGTGPLAVPVRSHMPPA